MRALEPTQAHLYKIDNCDRRINLGTVVNHEHQFSGILFPSVRMWASGDKLALLPWFVDQYLEFRKALPIPIDAQE